MKPDYFIANSFKLPLDGTTKVMGIVNVTPDSFYDGGKYESTELAVEHALSLVAQGADMIDIGGQTTKPGSQPISAETELARILPVISGLKGKLNVPISVDTYKPQVVEGVIKAGVDVINLIFQDEASEKVILDMIGHTSMGLVLAHNSSPKMLDPDRALDQLKDFFNVQQRLLQGYGIGAERVLFDPALGYAYGLDLAGNLKVINEAKRLSEDFPMLYGYSQKQFIGDLTGSIAPGRLAGTQAITAHLASQGVDFVRVHEVAEAKQLLTMLNQIWRA
ncbi:dihydropteroate synthase [Lacticaseibacillus zeae]|uniref:Dihydropteroate synthase n=1 Tax=Lacticaseibacillus zeae TaxID=57037 RepID=A0A5R8LGX3_LACZE|nr:dihydropteroate synthase [Lacticaseibacillus zeae]TLF36030.1 dihydropteroate synthase [Lacticaseibacillus zeae]